MPLAEDVLGRLLSLKSEHAEKALTAPGGYEAFDYGKACGVYIGICLCIEAINGMLESEHEAEIQQELKEG